MQDLLAGITAVAVIVPQGMGYAVLAGLPPVMGLYASFLPLAAYAVIGSSRFSSVGPVSVDSIMVASALTALSAQGLFALGSEEYMAAAMLLAVLAGLIQVVLGVVRLGFLANFLSRPVITGFTAAAAVVIVVSQSASMFGLDLPRSVDLHESLPRLIRALPGTHVATFGFGAGTFVLLSICRAWWPKFPAAMLVVVLSIVISSLAGAGDAGVALVGDVPRGLPPIRLPTLDFKQWALLLPPAVVLAFVGYMEALSVASFHARTTPHDIHPNRELFALGAANVVSGVTSGFAVTSGFSRTAVVVQSGARSQWANVSAMVMVGATLLFLTPLFQALPRATLAAIIARSVLSLVDVDSFKRLWRMDREDFLVASITALATLALGIQWGLLVGVGVSLAAFLFRTSQPHTAVLGRLPDLPVYRNIHRFSPTRTVEGVLIVRIDAQLYFGNVTFLRDTLRELEAKSASPLHDVILDASGINYLDSSAEAALSTIVDDYQQRGIQLWIASAKGPVRDVMVRSGFVDRIGESHMTLRVEDAYLMVGADNAPKPRISAVPEAIAPPSDEYS